LTFIENQYEYFKTIFPFNIIFGTFSVIQSTAENWTTNYQNLTIPLGFDSFMANTSVVLTSSTISNIIGVSAWQTIQELERYLIWCGVGLTIFLTII